MADGGRGNRWAVLKHLAWHRRLSSHRRRQGWLAAVFSPHSTTRSPFVDSTRLDSTPSFRRRIVSCDEAVSAKAEKQIHRPAPHHDHSQPLNRDRFARRGAAR